MNTSNTTSSKPGVVAKRPNLSNERLQEMQIRASKIWRGEMQPKGQCAADVLYLVAEIRSLREVLSKLQNLQSHAEVSASPDAVPDLEVTNWDSIFKMFKDLDQGSYRDERPSFQQTPKSTQASTSTPSTPAKGAHVTGVSYKDRFRAFQTKVERLLRRGKQII